MSKSKILHFANLQPRFNELTLLNLIFHPINQSWSFQLIAEGQSKLASVPSGGSGGAAAPAAAAAGGAAPAAAEEKKEEKAEEKEESDDDMGFGLFD